MTPVSLILLRHQQQWDGDAPSVGREPAAQVCTAESCQSRTAHGTTPPQRASTSLLHCQQNTDNTVTGRPPPSLHHTAQYWNTISRVHLT